MIPSRRTERTAVSAVGTVDVAATVVAAVAVTVAVADNMTDTLVTDEGKLRSLKTMLYHDFEKVKGFQ